MKRILAIAIVAILLIALIGWRYVKKTDSDKASKTQSAQRKNAATIVEVATAGPRQVSNSISAVGTLESPFTVKLSPNVAGRIDYLEVREGNTVNKGDVLARIDPTEVDGEIQQARAAVSEADQKLAQARVTQNSTAVGIYGTINQNEATVAGSKADLGEVQATYEAMVGAAHEATVDAQSKVSSAAAQVKTNEANLELAQANYEDAEAKFKREDSLYQQGFAAAQDLDDAKASVKVNKATVNAQQKMVDAANSALKSAEAEERAAANQESITRKKGLSDIEDAKAKLTESNAVLKTAVANKSQIPAYAENLKALYSEVVNAKAALQSAIARRQYLILTSSIDGTVTQRLADPGAEASPGSPILVLQSLKWLFVTSTVPSEYTEFVKPGQDVQIKVDALPGQTFHAKIVDINKSTDPTSRQFMIRSRLDNDQNLFRPGMFTRTTMVSQLVDAPVAVPREAVAVATDGAATVTTVDDQNIAHVVPVVLGAQDTDYYQISSGINAGDKVVTLSYRPVKDGGNVAVGKPGAVKDAKDQDKNKKKGGHRGGDADAATGGDPSGTSTAAPAAPSTGSAPQSSSDEPATTTGASQSAPGTSAPGAPTTESAPGATAPGGSTGIAGAGRHRRKQ